MDEPRPEYAPPRWAPGRLPAELLGNTRVCKLERDLAQEVRVPGHLRPWCHFPRETWDSVRFLLRGAENKLSNVGKTEDPGMRFWLR